MPRLIIIRSIIALCAILAALAARPSAAHSDLERMSPPADSLLAAPPRQIDLWFTEPVVTEGYPPTIAIRDETGAALTVTSVTVDASDGRHVIAEVDGLASGTYTVTWSVQSATDGHQQAGSFAFRVGGAVRAPGAATTSAERPLTWAVVTRWTAFLGAAIAAAGFAATAFPAFALPSATRRRRNAALLIAAGAGLLATMLEPMLQARFPGPELQTVAIGDAIAALPSGWWVRLGGLAAALLLGLGATRLTSSRPVGSAGVAAGLIALAGLALTSHAAGRETLRLPAMASMTLHAWTVGLWVGGLVMLGLSLRPSSGDGIGPALRAFSRAALPLAVIGIATGVVNSGLTLPAYDALWTSGFGRLILLKVVLLLPVLALATRHRRALARIADEFATALSRSLRIETALVAVVVLAGSGLVLSAPPAASTDARALNADLAAPLAIDGTPTTRFARLRIDPLGTGANTFSVTVTEGPPVSVADGAVTQAPPVDDVVAVRLTATSLNAGGATSELDLIASSDGSFTGSGQQISFAGWWQLDVRVRRNGMNDAVANFYVIAPDPNVHGTGAISTPDSDDNAAALFTRGLAATTSATAIRYIETLGGGTGTVVVADHAVRAATGDQPAALQIVTDSTHMIRMSGRQYLRINGGEWRVTDAGPVIPPSEWGTDYAGAEGFQTGITVDGPDGPLLVITFHVPATTLAAAWYAWWIDPTTGRVQREAMVSRGHYMVKDYTVYDGEITIEAPV